MRSIMRIGVLHPRFLGDAILATPLLRSLDAASHEIVHLAPAPLRKVAALVPWGRWRYLAGEPPRRIQAEEKLDAIILPATLDSQARWAFDAGVPIRVGRPRPAARPWLTHVSELLTGQHESEWILSLLEPLGISAASRRLEIAVPADAINWAESFLHAHGLEPGRFTLFCPFSNRVSSEWTAMEWIALARRLCDAKEPVVVDAPPGHAEKSVGWPVISTEGKSSIPQFAALMALARIVVTIDSASMHIAAALQARTVALFGPTDPRMYGGYPAPFVGISHPPACGPCFRAPLDWLFKPETCPHPYECMKSITVNEVFAEWRKLNEEAV
jgi:ADP-heptose:LPS heptosyltransferase